jgi:ribose 5-phosphate isomerase A
VNFAGLSRVDLTIDGADEIDGDLHAIKGGGGALLREKIVAAASTRMIAVVDSSKLVPRLGRFPLPIEALPFAAAWVEQCVSDLGARVRQRAGPDASPFTTDQGNFVFDAAFGEITDAAGLARTLDGIAGVLEHGLFISEIDAVYIGRGNGVEMRTRSTPPRA